MTIYSTLDEVVDSLVDGAVRSLISEVRQKIIGVGNFRDITINDLDRKIVSSIYKCSHKKMYEFNEEIKKK